MRIHGGNIYSESCLLDFSSNINPLGMPDSVRDAIIRSAADCTRYPNPHCTALTEQLAEYEGIPASQIVCGNGAADLIYRIVHALHPKRGLILAPTFSEYRFAMAEAGCEIVEYPLDPDNGFEPDNKLISWISGSLDILFLCNPNNPNGKRFSPDLLKEIEACCARNDVILVSDESFLRFSERAEEYSLLRCLHKNGIVLNAFTKLYGIPGLRLGYTLCGSNELADRIRNTGQFWSVSVPAQAAGIAALHERGWIENTVRYVTAERMFLSDSLKKTGITVYEIDVNFLLLNAPSEFARKLKHRGILLRECADFHGLSDAYFRTAVRTHSENLALISAIHEVTR